MQKYQKIKASEILAEIQAAFKPMIWSCPFTSDISYCVKGQQIIHAQAEQKHTVNG